MDRDGEETVDLHKLAKLQLDIINTIQQPVLCKLMPVGFYRKSLLQLSSFPACQD
jgi:hypothetical protein